MDDQRTTVVVRELSGVGMFLPPVTTGDGARVWCAVTSAEGLTDRTLRVGAMIAPSAPEGPLRVVSPDQIAPSLDLAGVRATERDWLRRHPQQAAELTGQWAAIDGDELVSHGRDLREVLRLAEEAGHPHPFITPVGDPRVPATF